MNAMAPFCSCSQEWVCFFMMRFFTTDDDFFHDDDFSHDGDFFSLGQFYSVNENGIQYSANENGIQYSANENNPVTSSLAEILR